MKTSVVLFTLLFGVVVFVAKTSARPNHREYDVSTYDEERDKDNDFIKRNRDNNRRGRRTRHSRHIEKRYDHSSSWFYDNYRDYMILQELYHIKQLLEELPESLKNDQKVVNSPQQPIYIPVPIYLAAQGTKCSGKNTSDGFVPNINDRINIDSELNPIWGSEQGENAVDSDDDGARPISFKPVKVNRPQGTPPPPVEHGSAQAGVSTTAAPSLTSNVPRREPNKCDAAILSCCRFTDITQKQCFQQYGCIKTYDTGLACTQKAIQNVIALFKEVFGPR